MEVRDADPARESCPQAFLLLELLPEEGEATLALTNTPPAARLTCGAAVVPPTWTSCWQRWRTEEQR